MIKINIYKPLMNYFILLINPYFNWKIFQSVLNKRLNNSFSLDSLIARAFILI